MRLHRYAKYLLTKELELLTDEQSQWPAIVWRNAVTLNVLKVIQKIK